MAADLVRVRNRETGEELLIGQSHLDRWPDDPFDVLDDTPAPAPATTPVRQSSTDDDD